jgi:hypothetical protein
VERRSWKYAWRTWRLSWPDGAIVGLRVRVIVLACP